MRTEMIECKTRMSNRRTLELGKATNLPRKLYIATGDGKLRVAVYPPSSLNRMLAFAVAELSDCRIQGDAGENPALWVGRSSFDISDSEAAQIIKWNPDIRDERHATDHDA